MSILLEDLNLRSAERTLCETALQKAGSIVEAAHLLGITRHALKRRMIKHRIEWPLAASAAASPARDAMVSTLTADPVGAFSPMQADG